MQKKTVQKITLQKIRESRDGFTLVEILVAAAIGGIAILILGSSMNLIDAGAKKVDQIAEISELKSMVVGSISCKETFANLPSRPPCSASGQYIDIKGKTGKILIENTGSKMGQWTVRALCTADGIDIRGSIIIDKFAAQSRQLSDWRGQKKPADPKKYKQDRSLPGTDQVLSWANPLTSIAKPGPIGLCSDFFASQQKRPECGADQYLKSVNLKANTIECRDLPKCTLPDTLKFNGKDFVCTPALSNKITTEITNYRNQQIGPLDTIANNNLNMLVNKKDELNNKIKEVFNPKNDKVKFGYTDSECRKASFRCDDGWVMTSYEYRYGTPSSQKCSMNCRKIRP